MADRAVESVLVVAGPGRAGREPAHDRDPRPARHHPAARPGQRAVRRRGVRDRRRAAREHRASGRTGQPAGATRRCGSSKIPSCRIATSPRRRSASRSRASGSGMYGEHVAGRVDRAVARRRSTTTGWIAAHTVASVIAIAVLTYLHIVLGEMVPKALALQRAAHDDAVRLAGHRGARARAAAARRRAERVRQRAAAAGRHPAAARSSASGITRPRSCSSSSRKARRAGCCAASPARSCASCSSSAT